MTTAIQGSSTAYAQVNPLQREIEVAGETPVRSREVTVTAPDHEQDSVKLTITAEVDHLVQQGLSASEIANTLGLTTSLVNSYLYVPLNSATASAK